MGKYIIIALIVIIRTSLFAGDLKDKYQELMIYTNSWQFGSAVLDNEDESLIIMESKRDGNIWDRRIYWYSNGKEKKEIQNATYAAKSVDNKYFSYISNHNLNIFDNAGNIKNILKYDGKYIFYALPVFSSYLYYYEKDKKYKIIKYDIETGKQEEIIATDKYQYINPVTVSNTNFIYLLENHNFGEGSEKCTIVKFFLDNSKFENLKIPIAKYEIKNSYTISPNNKYLIFANNLDFYLYIIDIEKNKVIDKIEIPKQYEPPEIYSWRNDSSYVIFSFGNKQIVKYVIPKE